MRSRRGRRGRIWLPDPLSDHPLNTGLVGCWDGLTNDPFVGGSVARDIAPYRHHGTLVNGTTWEPGPYGGYGWGFDGTDDYVDGGDISHLFASTQATLCTWLKRHNHTPESQEQTGSWTIGSTFNNHYPWTDGEIYDGTFKSTRETVGSGGISDRTEWHQVCITRTSGASGWKFYQNAKLIYSADGGSWRMDSVTKIGETTNPLFNFFGQIAYLRIYNRALSAAEVAALYLQQLQGSPDLYRWVSTKMYSIPSGAPTGSPWYYYLQEQLLAG